MARTTRSKVKQEEEKEETVMANNTVPQHRSTRATAVDSTNAPAEEPAMASSGGSTVRDEDTDMSNGHVGFDDHLNSMFPILSVRP